MSGLAHLEALARGNRPLDDGLLGNARCAWHGLDLQGEESILAAFADRPFDLDGELVAVETSASAALIGDHGALIADVYGTRIGRLWRVGDVPMSPATPAVDVAFDIDMRQERGDLLFQPSDHPDLQPAAVEPLLAAVRAAIAQERGGGRLRIRAFVVRAFGSESQWAALLSLFTLGGDPVRSAAFRYAAIAASASGSRLCRDLPSARDWTPRL